jgi:hypothetical protein
MCWLRLAGYVRLYHEENCQWCSSLEFGCCLVKNRPVTNGAEALLHAGPRPLLLKVDRLAKLGIQDFLQFSHLAFHLLYLALQIVKLLLGLF